MSSVLLVDELTGLFHILGHARGATAKHSNLPDLLGEEEVKTSSAFRVRACSVSTLKPRRVRGEGSFCVPGEGLLPPCMVRASSVFLNLAQFW